MSRWLSRHRVLSRQRVLSRHRVRAVTLVTVMTLCAVICVPAANAIPVHGGGGAPAVKMFGYAHGPLQRFGSAAGRAARRGRYWRWSAGLSVSTAG